MVFSCSFCKKKCVKGIGCYSFPKDKNLCDQWLVACNFDLHPQNNTLKLKLCSRHFKKDCFIMKDNGRKLLKPNAIPTILHTGKVKVQELNLLKSQSTCYTSPDYIQMKCEIGEVKIEPYTVDSRFTEEGCLIIKTEIEDDTYTEKCITNNIKNESNINSIIKTECETNESYNTNTTPPKRMAELADYTIAIPNKRIAELTDYTVASLDFSTIEPCNMDLHIKEEFEVR
ncbi:THAP domain [Popillia japonica]|uniref:THAP domain n=1 Tax=Popillia japonica TaxID=7064 RepID=A0AAW1M5N8_POPJA